MAKVPTWLTIQANKIALISGNDPKITAAFKQLSLILNPLIIKILQAFQTLTITDNFVGFVKDVRLDGSAPSLQIDWDQTSKPAAVWVGNVVRADGKLFAATDPIYINWQWANTGKIEIVSILGLTPTLTDVYIVTIVAIAR